MDRSRSPSPDRFKRRSRSRSPARGRGDESRDRPSKRSRRSRSDSYSDRSRSRSRSRDRDSRRRRGGRDESRSRSRSYSPDRRQDTRRRRSRSRSLSPRERRWPKLESRELQGRLEDVASKIKQYGKRYEDTLRDKERNNPNYDFLRDESVCHMLSTTAYSRIADKTARSTAASLSLLQDADGSSLPASITSTATFSR